jgi:hypothetical protein
MVPKYRWNRERSEEWAGSANISIDAAAKRQTDSRFLLMQVLLSAEPCFRRPLQLTALGY